MGGLKAPIAAIAAALFALALGPAAAVAEGPLDAASAVQPVQQRAAEIADPVIQQATSAGPGPASAPAPGAVREVVAPPPDGATDAVRGPSDVETRVAPAVETSPAPQSRPASPSTKTRPEGGRGRARDVARRHGKRPSPTAVISSSTASRDRARVATESGERTVAATPAPEPAPGDAGTAAGPRAFAAPGSFVLVASLIVLLTASRPFCLRPLRTPARTLRRLAFVSPGVPPG